MFEVRITRDSKTGKYTSRFKRTDQPKSQPFAAADTKEILVAIAERAGMAVVNRWS